MRGIASINFPKLALIWQKLFVISSAIILILTAVAKYLAAFGNAKILQVADPLTGLPFRELLFFAATLEVIVALICMFSQRGVVQFRLIAWLALIFLVYRLGLIWIGYHRPCSCLGNLTDALHIPPQIADMAMKIILAYLLIGSYVSLFWLWWQRKSHLHPRLLDALAK